MIGSALLASSLAAAPLVPYDDPHFRMNVPKGWKISSDWDHGKVSLQEDPGRPEAVNIQIDGAREPNPSEKKLLESLESRLPPQVRLNLKDIGPTHFWVEVPSPKGVARMGAALRAEPGLSLAAVMVAPPASFDAAGGVELLRELVFSVRVKGEPPPPSPPSDPQRHLAAPDVVWRRPGGITAEGLEGTWVYGDAMSTRVVDSHNGVTERYHLNQSGLGMVFEFSKNRTYEWTVVTTVNNNDLGSNIVERGKWSLDDATLTLAPASIHMSAHAYGKSKDYPNKPQPPRKMRLSTGLAELIRIGNLPGPAPSNGAVFLEGPCPVYVDNGDCHKQTWHDGWILQRQH
jgi:hypothetical protein